MSASRTQYAPASTLVVIWGSVPEEVTTDVFNRHVLPSQTPTESSIGTSSELDASVTDAAPNPPALNVFTDAPRRASVVGSVSEAEVPVGSGPVLVTTRTVKFAGTPTSPASATLTQYVPAGTDEAVTVAVSVDATSFVAVVGEQEDPDTIPRFTVTFPCTGSPVESVRLASVTAMSSVTRVVNVNGVEVPDGTSTSEKNLVAPTKPGELGDVGVFVLEQAPTKPISINTAHRIRLPIVPAGAFSA